MSDKTKIRQDIQNEQNIFLKQNNILPKSQHDNKVVWRIDGYQPVASNKNPKQPPKKP